jgi:hypothetical protein
MQGPFAHESLAQGRQDPSTHSQKTLYSVRRLGPFGQFEKRIIIFLFSFGEKGKNRFYICHGIRL